eukprot:g27042.t1
MGEQLNKYFGSVFAKEDTNNLQEMLGDRGPSIKEELKEILISQEMLLGILMGLKAEKSPGLDALHPKVLKEVALEMTDAVVIIFQHSVESERDVTSRVDKGESADVVYLDFQKAFDKVPHKGLVRKIKAIGGDTKLGGSVCCEEDAKTLQGDSDRLAEW